MVEATRIPHLTSTKWTASPGFLGALSLGTGAAALAVVLSNFGSSIVLGALMVPWILCGRGLFVDPGNTSRANQLIGNVLFWSAAATALVVLSELYMLALGPSWIL